MAGYYCSFCRSFLTIAHPLTSLLSPTCSFIWSEECQYRFEAIKNLLCSLHILAALINSLPYKLDVDASAVGAGAVLPQEAEDGIDHPVCYFSLSAMRIN